MRPILLAGPPAAGKSTTGRLLAASTPLGAFVDVDDVRHLVVSGHAAPWEGDAGRRQQRIGVENACDIARRFARAHIDVVLADVLTPETMQIYRATLTGVTIVGLRISLAEARHRANQRPMDLTLAEFERLHHDEVLHPLDYDNVIDVDHLDNNAQLEAARHLWA